MEVRHFQERVWLLIKFRLTKVDCMLCGSVHYVMWHCALYHMSLCHVALWHVAVYTMSYVTVLCGSVHYVVCWYVTVSCGSMSLCRVAVSHMAVCYYVLWQYVTVSCGSMSYGSGHYVV